MNNLLPAYRAVLVFFLFFTSSASNAAQLSWPTDKALTQSTDRIIVKYREPMLTASAVEEMVVGISGVSGQRVSFFGRTHNRANILQLESSVPLDQLEGIVARIETIPGVEYAEPDLILLPLFTPDDPRYSEQWHYFEETGGIALPQAWDTARGEGSVVAVLDTGYLPHQDLIDNLLPGYDMISDIDVANDGDARDDDATDTGDYAPECGVFSSSWHGTHVAGTVAATGDNGIGVTGVAFRARVLPVRVLGKCGGYLSDIADAIVWASGTEVASIPINPHPADVINMSLGGPAASCPQTLQQAIDQARQNRSTLVVSAGNESQDSTGVTPANCDGVITVANTTRSGGRAALSNFGDKVDLAAPGEGVLSTYNDGAVTAANDSYAFASGTSMSAPHVSGVAALLHELDPELDPDAMEQILTFTARPFPQSCSGCGSGILDAASAVSVAADWADLTLLQNRVPVTGIGALKNETLLYAIRVPEEVAELSFSLSGGSGDADLYVRHGAEPTLSNYDCRPYLMGNQERCIIEPVAAGPYYAMLHGFSDFTDTTLVASYILKSERPIPLASFENQQDYPIPEHNFYGISSPITIDRDGEPSRLEVQVDIKHPHIREIFVELIDPDDTSYTLKAFGGADESDLEKRYSLDIADKMRGTWKLKVRDYGGRGSGFIDYWRITFF